MSIENNAPLDEFKPREIEILQFMSDGFSNDEIAEKLYVTKETVRWYNKQIYSKLGTSRRTEAIALARQFGLIGEQNNRLHFNNVPVPTGTLWGRDNDITRLTELLQQPLIRLVTLVAPGGMGKTRLTTEIAHQMHGDYTDGVYFFDLAPLRDAQSLIPLMIELFELRPSVNNPMKPVLDFCRDKKLLLVFDNFEPIMDAKIYLVEILKAAPRVKIMVTSRERFDISEETSYVLNPLETGAEELFIETAKRRYPDFQVTEPNLPHIQEVCRLVEGMPLGIILAAAWVDVLSVEEIATEIKKNIDFLADELTTLPRRQRSMRAVLQQMWKRLTQDEQTALMRLSVFRGGFNRYAAWEITETSLHALRALLSKAVIQQRATGRFDLHTLILEFAHHRFTASNDYPKTSLKHAQFYADFIQTHVKHLEDERLIFAVQNAQAEFDNFAAAIDFALLNRHIEIATQFLNGSWLIFNYMAQYKAYIDYIDQCLPAVENPLDKIDLLTGQAKMWMTVGSYSEVEKPALQVQEIIQQLSDQSERIHIREAHLFYILGTLMTFRGEQDKAREYHHKALSVLPESEALFRSTILRGLCRTELYAGRLKEAKIHVETLMKLDQISTSLRDLMDTYYLSGLLYDFSGEFENAFQSHQQYLHFARASNDRYSISTALGNLGWNAEQRGDYKAAYQYQEEALRAGRRDGFIPVISGTLINMGFVALRYGNQVDAYEHFVEGIETAVQIQSDPYILEALVGIVMIAYQRGDYAYSAALFEFIKNHEATNPDVNVRLEQANVDFEAVMTPEALEMARAESQTYLLDTVLEQLLPQNAH